MRSRKLLPALMMALGMASAGNASAIVVGGIDFGALGLTGHLETTTLAETLILGNGQNLMGYGVVNTANGDSTYCAVDANCRLFFSFTSYTSQNFSPATVQFSGGLVNIYYDPGTGGASTGNTRNLLDFSSAANLLYINALAPWVQLQGHGNLGGGLPANATLAANGTLTGNSISFTGSGLLDVVLGAFGLASVQSFLNGNGLLDALGNPVDIALTTSGSNALINPNDVCTGVAGQFCIQGTADIRGPTHVPEPGSIALTGLALALLGVFGKVRRRGKKTA